VAQGICYVGGERFDFGPACAAVAMALCDHERLDTALLHTGLQHPAFVRALTQWVNDGYWYFDDEPQAGE